MRDNHPQALESKAMKKLTLFMDTMKVDPTIISSNIRWKQARSARGVPHVVIRLKDNRTFSICWFWVRGVYRVFFPFPSDDAPQQRFDFETPTEVKDFFVKEVSRVG